MGYQGRRKATPPPRFPGPPDPYTWDGPTLR